ncbi:MAG: hypothetical protein ACKKMV_00315 [Candidatus Nealsonbacteria bacterium]
MKDQKLGWILQLWRIASDSTDKDKKGVAIMLKRALEIELRRIERIKQLAKILCDYQLTSPSVFS